MLTNRCRYCLCRIMSRCSLSRLVIATTAISIMATISFFMYSRTLDTHGHDNTKQGLMKLRARSKHTSDNTNFVEKPQNLNFVEMKNRPLEHGTGEIIQPRPKDQKVVEKMSWPDKRKGDKGRRVARVREPKKWSRKSDVYSGVTDPLAVPRIAEYCNLPTKEVRGKEGEAPAGYSLRSVYVVVRHGDRSPMVSFKTTPNPPLSCQFTETNTLDIPNLNKFRSVLDQFQARLHQKNTFSFPLYPKSSACDSMQLTGQGVLQHMLNGLHLNHRYVQKWRLFSEPFTPDQVYIKSTGYTRTYQSAIALLYTFLPTLNLTDLNIFRSDNVFFCSEKSFGHSCSCPALNQFKKMSDSEAGAFNKNNTNLRQTRQHVANVFNMKRQELPWLWSMIDTLMIYPCHKIPLPCNKNNDCIEPSTLAELWHQLDLHGERLEQIPVYQKYSRLGMHPLLYEIKQHMLLTTKRRAKVKFALYSGHDSTVTPLASALGLGTGRWPKYATRIIFELYAREDPKKHHFIRVLMNGEDVTSKVSFCKGLAKNGFCKLKYFVDFVQKENLSIFNGKTFAQACSLNKN